MKATDAEGHRSDVEEWRRARYAALRRELGWLTLAGLGWLHEGRNTVGSDPRSGVVLPSGPPFAGTMEVADGRIVASGVFELEGAPVDGLELKSDSEGGPTLLALGALRLCVIDRGGRLAVRMWDADAPARDAFAGIDHWPVDRAWQLAAHFEATPGRMLGVPDVLGTVDQQPSPGDVVFAAGGETHRLQALPGGDGGELWLVFSDATNGDETYGGGRFLYTRAPDGDGAVEVDFNRAYNPPCVFSPYATCPLPWPENRLPIRIEAGERDFGAHG